jgi:Ala-tRNA(Pro) deacylase
VSVQKLRDFLDKHNIQYVTSSHSLAYTAQETAAAAHIAGQELAKTVMVKIEDKLAMAVVPASFKVNLDLLRKATGANKVELAHEQEFGSMFPESEVGAMPPFGNLYGMEVFVDESLSHDEEIAFNAGSHTELMKLAYKDFERLINPKVASFAAR